MKKFIETWQSSKMQIAKTTIEEVQTLQTLFDDNLSLSIGNEGEVIIQATNEEVRINFFRFMRSFAPGIRPTYVQVIF